MYRFIHAADLHLDTPFVGLGKRSPDLALRMQNASLVALRNLVDHAITERVHFVVIAGDIYDGLSRGVRAQLALRRQADRLHESGIPLILLHGNHDPLDTGYGAVKSWPESTTFLSDSEPQCVELITKAGRVTITGQSYDKKHVYTNLAATYPRPQGEGLHLAVLHTQVCSRGGKNPYSPCYLSELKGAGFHYWALGHIHGQKILSERPLVAYSGNTQGRTFGETGTKGALLVKGTPERLSATMLPLAPLELHVVSVDLEPITELADVEELLLSLAPKPKEGTQVLLRAELTGRSLLYASLQEEDTVTGLLSALSDQAAAGSHWLSVKVKVSPVLDIELLAKGQDLAGALIVEARRWVSAREAIEKKALKGFVKSLEDEEIDHLLHRAMLRAVDAVRTT